jgi:hypothetical protein
MPMVFPTSPVVGQVFSSGGRSWVWNGATWDSPRSDNPPLAIPTGNAIINGGFDIWQRGTSFSGGAGVYTADRWALGLSSSSAVRSTDTPTGSGFSAIISRTSGSVSGIRYRIEANDSRLLKGETVTLSWWAKEGATDSSTANVELRYPTAADNFGTVTTFSSGEVGTLSTSWQRFSKTILLPAEVSNGLELLFVFSGINKNHFITNVQLEKGAVATPFRRNAPSIQAELAACQRYYFRSGNPSTSNGMVASAGFTFNSGVASCFVHFPVEMRVRPTSIDFSSVSTDRKSVV